jgi:hypothetical protein
MNCQPIGSLSKCSRNARDNSDARFFIVESSKFRVRNNSATVAIVNVEFPAATPSTPNPDCRDTFLINGKLNITLLAKDDETTPQTFRLDAQDIF